MTDQSYSVADHDTSTLAQRVLRRREHYARSAQRAATFPEIITRYTRHLIAERRALPVRYVLHVLVGLLVPLAILLSQVPFGSPAVVPSAVTIPSSDGSSDLVVPIGRASETRI